MTDQCARRDRPRQFPFGHEPAGPTGHGHGSDDGIQNHGGIIGGSFDMLDANTCRRAVDCARQSRQSLSTPSCNMHDAGPVVQGTLFVWPVIFALGVVPNAGIAIVKAVPAILRPLRSIIMAYRCSA
jgi:hypothetical protein